MIYKANESTTPAMLDTCKEVTENNVHEKHISSDQLVNDDQEITVNKKVKKNIPDTNFEWIEDIG